MNQNDTGFLLNPNNIKLHRFWFDRVVKQRGVMLIYRQPKEGKEYSGYGELDSAYYEPKKVGCLFEEHPTIWTMRKLGWNSELTDSNLIVHVPYDLEGLQAGALFIVPSAIDNTQGRVFKVLRMSTTMIYPASIACEIGPMLINEHESSQNDYSRSNFNILDEGGDEDAE